MNRSILRGATLSADYLWHEAPATKSLLKTQVMAIAVPLASAVLSVLCLAIMCFVDDPWFAAAGFVPAYSLFWASLPPR
jgi:hypothetical protein